MGTRGDRAALQRGNTSAVHEDSGGVGVIVGSGVEVFAETQTDPVISTSNAVTDESIRDQTWVKI